ncbi:hypothetical protein KVR01_002655 [Diaporthe batatas]|uniref:uncharacterized protein n=1 Tax=Diaporthe batatas TaxID=748121 RepID=UPI001D03F562|nr:uncharacterized protein KVR01_002655 [Diaporthe batatas]KAG8166966.1 hypothetical protein KVR01_002655 [Diaporthe batatas]
MCGIHALISASHPAAITANLRRCLCGRGPDHITTLETQLVDGAATTHLSFTSSVLALRGDHVAQQPFVDAETGSILCWNGEAWKIRHHDVSGNDGEAIAALLGEAVRRHRGEREAAILQVLRSIDGPFAFVFFDKPSSKIYYGRDRLGRRSLVLLEEGQRVTLSSIADAVNPQWREVEADGIYVLDAASIHSHNSSEDNHRATTRLSWLDEDDAVDFVSNIGHFNSDVPEGDVRLAPGSPPVTALRQQLTESLRLRVLNVPLPPGADEHQQSARVAVLFSGGLDCTVIARMCHDLIPLEQSIDLINVAFENPRVAANAQKLRGQEDSGSFNIYEACPDRMTGRKSFAELQEVCPGRAWNFIAVNVPYSEYSSHKAEVVSLIYPHNTEMDLSIACALYFSARGQGVAITDATTTASADCTTGARVLLSGLGADELFGGYQRHATAYQRQGYPGLVDELKLDVSRLGKRNLGRDDRVMSHWGKEVRFPYLDEELVRWAIGTPAWEKCDFSNPDGVVEAGKRVLRLVALELGMSQVATEKKRAIQFGSRTAKMESGKVKGTTPLS